MFFVLVVDNFIRFRMGEIAPAAAPNVIKLQAIHRLVFSLISICAVGSSDIRQPTGREK